MRILHYDKATKRQKPESSINNNPAFLNSKYVKYQEKNFELCLKGHSSIVLYSLSGSYDVSLTAMPLTPVPIAIGRDMLWIESEEVFGFSSMNVGRKLVLRWDILKYAWRFDLIWWYVYKVVVRSIIRRMSPAGGGEGHSRQAKRLSVCLSI